MSDNPYRIPQSHVDSKEENEGEIKYFSHKGRIGRLRYFFATSIIIFGGVFWAGFWILQSLKLALGSETELPVIMRNENFISFISSATPFIVLALCLLPSLQRLHDLNRQGWFVLLLAVPAINIILWLALCGISGTPTHNQFGAPPPQNSLLIKITSILLVVCWIWLGYFAFFDNFNSATRHQVIS
ncbi:MAG: DUF805 domain-containing protein [Thiotrichaceae bacterium]|nr:DUF805 domain-containing protein [Thiotrichaceae bacterium]